MHVILMGPQGAGKGTQAARVAPRLGLVLIATGELFRGAIKAQTELGRRIKEAYDRGDLISDDVTIALVEEKLDAIARARAAGEGVRGALFDGFPRNRAQAGALEAALRPRGETLTAVVSIEVPRDVLVARLAGRRVCRRCGHVYHVSFNPTRRPGVCDVCGGEVVQREDDTPAAIHKRLDLYLSQTEPLIAHFCERGLVATVDGNQPIEAVTDDIVEAIAHRVSPASQPR